MDIPEVPIEQPRKRKIRASRKVLASTEQYLNGNGLSFNQLTPAQQTSVVKYIKTKRACLWCSLMALVLLIFMSVTGYRIYKDDAKNMVNLFMPDEYVVEAEDGSKVLKNVEEDLKEEIRMYGVNCSLLASLLIAGIYLPVYSLALVMIAFFQVRENRRMLEAFLPSVRKALQTENSSNG